MRAFSLRFGTEPLRSNMDGLHFGDLQEENNFFITANEIFMPGCMAMDYSFIHML